MSISMIKSLSMIQQTSVNVLGSLDKKKPFLVCKTGIRTYSHPMLHEKSTRDFWNFKKISQFQSNFSEFQKSSTSDSDNQCFNK